MKVSHTNQPIGFEADYQPCLFSVHGNSREMRRKRIETVAEQEPCLGFLAAVFDFEWMARRAILALSRCPAPFIRKYFEKKHGLNAYKEAWDIFLVKACPKLKQHFETVIASASQNVAENWNAITDAFALRHALVHGANGFIGDGVADCHMKVLLSASDNLEQFLNSNGTTVFKNIHRSYCPSSGMNGRGFRKESLGKRTNLQSRAKERAYRMNRQSSSN